jgi:thiol-disulfide isomerase/thioredoxin
MQSYENLKGEKLTLIDFWATWCKPCIKAIPGLNEIYKEYKVKGVNLLVSIAMDREVFRKLSQ